jgi:hypothetical protein
MVGAALRQLVSYFFLAQALLQVEFASASNDAEQQEAIQDCCPELLEYQTRRGHITTVPGNLSGTPNRT